MLPPRKDPIKNQYSTITIIQQDLILPLILVKWPTGYKQFLNDTHFLNKTEEEYNNSIDNSRTENEYFVNNLNVKKYEYQDDEYKEDNSESPKSNEIAIKKTEQEE